MTPDRTTRDAGRPNPDRPNVDDTDWTAEVADRIEDTVANLRRVVVEPVEKVTRGVVFGTLAVGFAVPAVIIALVLAFRGLVVLANTCTPGPNDNSWIAWYALGVAAVGGGMWLFAKRHPKLTTSERA